MRIKNRWGDPDWSKPKHSENNLSQYNFVYYKPRSDWPGFGRIRRLTASAMVGTFQLITVAPVSKNSANSVPSSAAGQLP